MARRCQPIRCYLPGIIVVLVITSVVLSALAALWFLAFESSDNIISFDAYLGRVLLFTFMQAALSTVISIVLAVCLAKALYQTQFWGKTWLLRTLSLTFVLPSLVVVTGLLTVYGNRGWLAQLCHDLQLDYDFTIYGLNGILIAHIFLNFPFATRYCYQSLLLIPNEQKQLAQQLGLSYLQTLRYLELPVIIKQLLPLSGLIFMMCFSSFATVLALSGGPKYTTIEVAIYQAVRDFELQQAVILSFIQLFFCLSFMMVLKRLEPKYTPSLLSNFKAYQVKTTLGQKWLSYGIIVLAAVFILAPLLAIIVDGVYQFSTRFLTPSLISALWTSLSVALCSAALAMILATSLLWTNSRLLLQGKQQLSEGLMLLGALILAIPSMVIAAGLFILFYNQVDNVPFIFMLVVICNSFLALPFILKQLAVPLADLTKQYHFLTQSLNIHGLNYFFLIDLKALKKLFAYCFALACIMSMGDFGIVALFGGQTFMTLPYYLYELLAHYRYDEAAFTALLLLVISFVFMTLFEYVSDDRT
ncbi:thiamine transport system permease protein [Orbus hercynius]|uniref:Thiamine transport system permease protein ThiP n=1 Tax=Orbus hercynius TaxID=593135 RepID=A0A495RIT7_9GAMM|nr:thiamine/thiamine pyrophosphate ABC transporter permease [Orbus hercynius]RKS87452.1 thiamine transport system permease protein [Orbus hercynius]